MKKLNFWRRAAARSSKLLEMCPPRVFCGPSRGRMVRATEYAETMTSVSLKT
jgi:hypothetical protein